MDVVVGIFLNQEEKVLLVQRPDGKPFAGLWEFPGGKVNAGETFEAALCREVQEEVGLIIQSGCHLGTTPGEPYGDVTPVLQVYLLSAWSGEAKCLEGQPALSWVHWRFLAEFDLPPANVAILKMLERWMADRPCNLSVS